MGLAENVKEERTQLTSFHGQMANSYSAHLLPQGKKSIVYRFIIYKRSFGTKMPFLF